MSVNVQLDQAKAAPFEGRLVEVLNAGALSLMVSIGHRTRLFDAMAELPPATSIEIARAAQLQERYVREWLGAMVAAGVVDYDAPLQTYRLPQEHAACLTRAAEPGNFAVFAQYIPLLGSVEDDVVRCFSEGGGVPYARYARFHEVMAEDSGQTVLPVLRDHILPLVPGLIERLEAGIRVLDVGCGRGRAPQRAATTTRDTAALTGKAIRPLAFPVPAPALPAGPPMSGPTLRHVYGRSCTARVRRAVVPCARPFRRHRPWGARARGHMRHGLLLFRTSVAPPGEEAPSRCHG
jgi:hypothetical protein